MADNDPAERGLTQEVGQDDEIALLLQRVSTLEGKMDQLFMRPRMPYSQNASSGDVLELDVDLNPQWVSV